MKVGPYETGRVYHGDCLELMKAIPDGAIPMIWTDPPYGCNQNDGGDLANRWEAAFGGRCVARSDEARLARPIANDISSSCTQGRGILSLIRLPALGRPASPVRSSGASFLGLSLTRTG